MAHRHHSCTARARVRLRVKLLCQLVAFVALVLVYGVFMPAGSRLLRAAQAANEAADDAAKAAGPLRGRALRLTYPEREWMTEEQIVAGGWLIHAAGVIYTFILCARAHKRARRHAPDRVARPSRRVNAA